MAAAVTPVCGADTPYSRASSTAAQPQRVTARHWDVYNRRYEQDEERKSLRMGTQLEPFRKERVHTPWKLSSAVRICD